LTPGKYSIVGTRPDYQYVRIELVIRPGEPPDPVTVSCTEKI
jgi:hypothetical protein